MPYVMQSKGQQQIRAMFFSEENQQKIRVLQSSAYVEPAHNSRGCFIFLVSFTD
jgi:hypothetical protein